MYNIIELFNHISIPLSPEKIIESFRGTTNKSKTTKGNTVNTTKHLYFLLFIVFLFTSGCPHEHPPNNAYIEVSKEMTSNCLINYYEILSELITTEFEAYFWKKSTIQNFKIMKDFSQKDFDLMKEDYWDIIEAKRIVIRKMENGDKLIAKVEKIFDYKAFQDNFDGFVKEHQNDSLQDFNENMVCYVTKIQQDILDKVIHY